MTHQDDITESFDSTRTTPPQTTKSLPAIDNYKLLDTLGEGGFGVVYLAEQTKPVKRRVALKVIKPGMDSKTVIARFEAERQALAVMNHPNVAKVFDAGTTQQGRPYFVMELVAGVAITEHCDRHKLDIVERLNLFIEVCEAVQHAHQKGIIHRDIKPSNILVEFRNDKSICKVIDFGVAKAIEQRLTERTIFTQQGQLIGTPAYMSPEQAEMTAQNIDTRSDIYSLGVVLYQLLTGVTPFATKTLLKAGWDEIRRVIREQEPQKPSTKLSSIGDEGTDSTAIAHNRKMSPTALTKCLRGDLDWVTIKALEKDRSRRYATATELADDIRRHLRHEPVLAGPPSSGYRFKKFIRRNRGVVTAIAAVIAVLTGGIVVSTSMYLRAERAREETAWERDRVIAAEQKSEERREDAEAVTMFLSDMLAAVKPEELGKDVTVQEVLDEASKSIGDKFKDRPLIEARLRDTIAGSFYSLGLYDAAELHFTTAARIYARELGERHPDTLSSISNLASTLARQGKLIEAEGPHRKTLEIHRRILGEEHPDTLKSMNNLAVTLQDMGKIAEAEELYRTTLEIRRRVLGMEHPDTLLSMNNLANMFAAHSMYAQAEEILQNTLKIQRRVQGEEHPATLRLMSNLAAALAEQGKLSEAEELCRKTLDINQRILGREHPGTLNSMNNLALMLQDQGKYPQAEKLHRKTLEVRRRVLGEEHPKTLRSIGNLGLLLRDMGKYEEALPYHRASLEGKLRVQGNDHPDTQASIHDLERLLRDLGQLEEAESLGEEAVQDARAKRTPSHPFLLAALAQHGRTLAALQRFTDAESELLEAYGGYVETRGLDYLWTKDAMQGLVDLYDAWTDAEPGKGYDQEAAEWRAKLPTKDETPIDVVPK